MNQPTVQELGDWQLLINNKQPWHLAVKVIVNCPRRGWQGQLADGSWKIGISEPAVDNRANQALLAWLAHELHCSIQQLTISSGKTGRRKIVRCVI